MYNSDEYSLLIINYVNAKYKLFQVLSFCSENSDGWR